MVSMIEALYHHASATPEALFAADERDVCTYEEAVRRVEAAARVLLLRNVRRGDAVAVRCTQDIRFLIINLACERIGAVFVPLEKGAAPERIRDILTESGAVLYIGTCAGDMPIPAASPDIPEAMETVDLPPMPGKGETAQILFTTGTTGKSKGILISHGSNIALAENILYGTGMKPGNVEVIPLPLSHSHALRCFYANLLGGNTIIIMDGLMNLSRLFAFMEKYHVTAVDLSPGAVQVLLKLAKKKLSGYADQLDYLEIGTAFLPEETKQQLIDLLPGVRLYNFYGSTESGRSCVLDFQAIRNKPGCIGKPTRNARIKFVDDEFREITTTKENCGLLASSGPMNMTGYLNQPELTASVMRDGWVFTSDLGYMDEDGDIYVLGRAGDVINYGGIKISPEEIEEIARRHPAVKDCACVPKKDPVAGQIPKLFLSVQDGATLDVPGFIAWLQERLDRNKLPKEVEIIPEIPRTYNGKLQRGRLL